MSKRSRKSNNQHNYKCVVPNCPGNGDTNLHFYGFPFGMPDVFHKWKKNLRMEHVDVKKHMNVCQLHFENVVMGKKKILKGGVPTLNLGHNDPIYLSCLTKRYRASYWQEDTFDDKTQQCLFLPDEYETFRFVKKADDDIGKRNENPAERRKLLTQQIINIKFCYNLQKSANETYQMLNDVYGEATLSRTNVMKIFARFREGWDVLPDGQPTPQTPSPPPSRLSSKSPQPSTQYSEPEHEELNQEELKYEYLEDDASISSDVTVVIETIFENDDDREQYYIE